MIAKEAREITKTLSVHEVTKQAAETYQLGRARGYLEANKKAGGTMKEIKEIHTCEFNETGKGPCKVCDLLAKWEKEG